MFPLIAWFEEGLRGWLARCFAVILIVLYKGCGMAPVGKVAFRKSVYRKMESAIFHKKTAQGVNV
jgi:hypothetical protein